MLFSLADSFVGPLQGALDRQVSLDPPRCGPGILTTLGRLHRSVNYFRFLGFLLCRAPGASGRPPEAPGRPTGSSGGPPGAPGPSRARVEKPKNLYFLQGPTERPGRQRRRRPKINELWAEDGRTSTSSGVASGITARTPTRRRTPSPRRDQRSPGRSTRF